MPPIVVMGVSGSGKSTIARLLAKRLAVPFCEGDDLHAPTAIAKMRGGHPLDDRDRAPWLARVNRWLRAHGDGGVVSCSALRRRYRARLNRGLRPPPAFVLLDPPATILRQRVARRVGHFMPASLLDSQLAALERPTAAERALCLSGTTSPEALGEAVVDWLDRRRRADWSEDRTEP